MVELIASLPPTMGARTVERITRASDARARFATGVRTAVTELPDTLHLGPELTRHIAETLTSEVTR